MTSLARRAAAAPPPRTSVRRPGHRSARFPTTCRSRWGPGCDEGQSYEVTSDEWRVTSKRRIASIAHRSHPLITRLLLVTRHSSLVTCLLSGQLEEALAELARDRAGLAGADGAVVALDHGDHFGGRAGQEE